MYSKQRPKTGFLKNPHVDTAKIMYRKYDLF